MTDSIVAICNRALSVIGARSQISSLSPAAPPGPESTQCALWYDKMRRRLLRTAQWGFARYQLSLTQLGDAYPDNTAPFPYLYKYAYPADAVKLRYILPPAVNAAGGTGAPNVSNVQLGFGWAPSRSCRWLVASDVDADGNQIKTILSNVQGATMVYTKDITNPNIFDDSFDTALSASIGAMIALPLTGNTAVRNSQIAAAEAEITSARAADGNEGVAFNDHTPDWIATRSYPMPSSYGPSYFPGNVGWGNWFGANDDMNWSA